MKLHHKRKLHSWKLLVIIFNMVCKQTILNCCAYFLENFGRDLITDYSITPVVGLFQQLLTLVKKVEMHLLNCMFLQV